MDGLGRRGVAGLALAGVLAITAGCSDAPLLPHEQILDVPLSRSWQLPGLQRAVQVVYTEANVPHIYATNRRDLSYVQGFVMARDRYFMMELSRRLGRGTISELLGDAALPVDQESRGSGMTFLAERIAARLSPELGEYVDAFAEGVNSYIEQVRRKQLPPPSELDFAGGLLGADEPTELMQPFQRIDVAAMIAVIVYQSSFETGDVSRAAAVQQLPTLFEGDALGDLRRAGAIEDLWKAIEPVEALASVPGYAAGATTGKTTPGLAPGPAGKLPVGMLQRLSQRLEKQQIRLRRDREAGFGSNAWAVAASSTSDGAALLAGDGHLSLAVPSILYQIGLDTSVFGRGDTHQLGMTIPGFPVVAIGTNGDVAWSQTQLGEDITDWYREELQLDASGAPSHTRFDGNWRKLDWHDESYLIADVPGLDSVGRTEVWRRYVTFDGRWLADVEGRVAAADEVLAPGETLLNLQGAYVVPEDLDGDGTIAAVSFDYTGFDAGSVFNATDALGHAKDVDGFREALRGLVAYSQNFTVADSGGRILYSSYQALPCRGYLDRTATGEWADGADPSLLLDGTRYGAFRIPITHGLVDETQGAVDPYNCVVPFAEVPQEVDPLRGYVATANNDPGGMSFDGSLTNDAWYFGGPWDTGFRARTISDGLEFAIADGGADSDDMAALQGDVTSVLAKLFHTALSESIDYARALPAQPTEPADQRVKALYTAAAARLDEVQQRLSDWQARNYQARSGVATFYADPSEDDQRDAVATMLFNAWLSRVMRDVFDDEGLPNVWRSGSTHGRVRALQRLLQGRGSGNPAGLASYNPATGESAFFDVLGSADVESSHEVILTALSNAVEALSATPDEPGSGGFGTSDMDAWLWGLRHQVRFESLLADFIGDDPAYAAITENFAITTATLQLAAELSPDDPRAGLKWFPRDGDQFNVDAANPGFSATRYSYGSGPVMRMVIALRGDEVSGRNILPGGQSALTDSPYFADQAAAWLGNDTLPLRFSVAQVVAGATSRESYEPQN